MITTLNMPKHKGKVRIVTQKYEVGLYVAVYFPHNSIPEQMGLDVNELEFHKDVRAGKFMRGRQTIILEESSAIN